VGTPRGDCGRTVRRADVEKLFVDGGLACRSVTAARAPREPAQAAATRVAPVGTRPPRWRDRLRLPLEGLGVTLLGLVAAWWQVPALRDPDQSIYDDLMTQAMGPDRHGLARMLTHGFFPSWTRYQFTGEPYAANTQHETLYPGSIPFLLLKTSTAMDVVIAVHIGVAFLGTWLFLRVALRTSAVAALLGAVAFGLSSQILGHITLGDQLHVLVWTPWVFLGTHLALERGRLRHVVLLAVAIGLQFLAGHPEEWVYCIGSACLYAAIWVLVPATAVPATAGTGAPTTGGTAPRRTERARRLPGQIGRRALHAATRVGGGLAGFVLLFGWALLPALLLQAQGFRSEGFSEQIPVPRLGGVNVLLPDYGRVLTAERYGFAGVVVLALFCLYLAAGRGRVWLRVFLGVSAALGYTMALGHVSKHPAFYDFFYDHVSLIHQFRVPGRWLLLTCFAFVVGGALGLDTLLERASVRDRLRRGALALVALAGVFGFAFLLATTNNDGASYRKWALAAMAGTLVFAAAQIRQVPRAALGLALVVVAAVEAHQARPSAEYRQKAPDALYDDYGALAQRVADSGGRYVSIAGDPLPSRPGVAGQRDAVTIPASVPTDARSRNYFLSGQPGKLDLRPNNHVAVGAQALNGRDNGLAPFGRYKDFFERATGLGGNIGSSRLPGSSACPYAPAPPVGGCPPPLAQGAPGVAQSVVGGWRWPALDLQGLTWVLANEALPAADQQVLRAHGFTPDMKAAYVQAWRRPAPPLVRVVHTVDVLGTRAERLTALSGYDFAGRAIVERPTALEPAVGSDTVAGTDIGQTRVSTDVTMGSGGLVVLADPFYPQWQVTVDGRPAPMLAVDQAFRGVVVPAGRHTVVFTYVDRRLQLGLGLAGGTILGLAVAGLVPAARRRRRGRPLPVVGGADAAASERRPATPAG